MTVHAAVERPEVQHVLDWLDRNVDDLELRVLHDRSGRVLVEARLHGGRWSALEELVLPVNKRGLGAEAPCSR